MNRGDLRTELERILAEGPTAIDFWPTAEKNSKLNEALIRFAMEEHWPFHLTVGTDSIVADQATFTLPVGVSFPRWFGLLLTPDGESAPYQPKRVTPADGYRLRAGLLTSTTSANPEFFYLVSMEDAGEDTHRFVCTVRLVAPPSRDFELEYLYLRVPDLMDSDDDIPDIPSQFHTALVHWAAAELWLKELDGRVKADEQYELYNNVLAQARADFLDNAEDDFVVVGGEEPQDGMPDATDWVMRRIPSTLGP